jgi:hypothetical protein
VGLVLERLYPLEDGRLSGSHHAQPFRSLGALIAVIVVAAFRMRVRR